MGRSEGQWAAGDGGLGTAMQGKGPGLLTVSQIRRDSWG